MVSYTCEEGISLCVSMVDFFSFGFWFFFCFLRGTVGKYRNLRQSSESEAEEADGRRKNWICNFVWRRPLRLALQVTDVRIHCFIKIDCWSMHQRLLVVQPKSISLLSFPKNQISPDSSSLNQLPPFLLSFNFLPQFLWSTNNLLFFNFNFSLSIYILQKKKQTL